MSIWKTEKTKYTTLAIIFLGIILITLLNHNWIVYKLNYYKLLPRKEPVVELYFTEPSKLPATYTPAQTISSAFTVHNMTETTSTFPYIITVQSENGPLTTISRGSITLQPDEAKSTPVTYIPTDLGPRITITVQLVDKSQHINFWADRR